MLCRLLKENPVLNKRVETSCCPRLAGSIALKRYGAGEVSRGLPALQGRERARPFDLAWRPRSPPIVRVPLTPSSCLVICLPDHRSLSCIPGGLNEQVHAPSS